MVPAQILIIEDNDVNRGLMSYLLQAFGHITIEAKDGAAGLETARRKPCDLILLDVFLPKLDGFDIVRALKRDILLRAIPVVAITALAMMGDRDRIIEVGFDAYMTKPITPETFVQDIEKFLPPEKRRWVARNVPSIPATVSD